MLMRPVSGQVWSQEQTILELRPESSQNKPAGGCQLRTRGTPRAASAAAQAGSSRRRRHCGAGSGEEPTQRRGGAPRSRSPPAARRPRRAPRAPPAHVTRELRSDRRPLSGLGWGGEGGKGRQKAPTDGLRGKSRGRPESCKREACSFCEENAGRPHISSGTHGDVFMHVSDTVAPRVWKC